MSEQPWMRTALSGMLEQFADGKPSQVLFTSFNYSAAFFENNVLPLLCGTALDTIKESPPSRAFLNEQLADMQVVVACDHSAHPEPKSNLRYGLMSVALRGGRFHPKLILMHGRLKSGRPGLWLCVTSANLSYSGWGVNREVFGTTPVSAQHAAQLAPLLEWLRQQAQARAAGLEAREEGETRQVLLSLLNALREYSLPDAAAAGLPSLHLALPAPVREAHPPLLAALLGGQSWQSASVISPFWSGVRKLLDTIRDERGGHAAFELVPAMQTADGYSFPAIQPQLPADYARFVEEPERYTHAKAMLLSAPGRKVLCIGSANFTAAALQHGQGYLSNVEAMLRYQVGPDYNWSGMLTALDQEAGRARDDADEGAPPLPPFQAEVAYDWHSRQFHCSVTPDPAARLGALTLEVGPLQHVFRCDDAATQHARLPLTLRQPVRSYQLHYARNGVDAIHVGLVTQLNADDDQLDYLPKPRLDQLLLLLLGLVPGKTHPRLRAGGGGDGEDSDPDGLDHADPVFDFFSFFLATDKLRRYYAVPGQQAGNPLGTGTATVFALYRAVTVQAAATPSDQIGRYVQLAELRETLAWLQARYPDQAPHPAPALLDSELRQLEASLAPLLSASPHWQAMFGPRPPDARTFLNWFREELKHKADTP
ncbi:hypothetical protein FHW58_001471 [Duganella sp. 1224]|uniref:hypothetical protein n=1 Tax=Duganella sp. 1224 TaxID=2587052 RepID=UPI0015C91A6F|nr:hypothetical protein [Duganella sp. 1224]NYE60319.1 hypothetical protein [Duganella sp. 1224]